MYISFLNVHRIYFCLLLLNDLTQAVVEIDHKKYRKFTFEDFLGAIYVRE